MKIWFIDVELSGTRAFDEVIDFALLEYEIGSTQPPTVIFDSLIKGADEITPFHRELTGISVDDINNDKLPTISSVVNLIENRPYNTLLASYSLQYDLNWINHSYQLAGGTGLKEVKGICLLESVTEMIGHKVSLDKALGIQRETHRAIRDARLHYELFKGLDRKYINVRAFIAKFPDV